MQNDKDDTVYCNIRMPVAQGRQLLQVVNALRESQALPTLDRVLQDIQNELISKRSINPTELNMGGELS